ncbi:hypothetical protein EDB81DRAFT_925036 [Dactylonectria macrodidyma]|uniref:BZIP transcription factor n=1 Tax=Dactylonectria macrodidyma TaxID=307937 RepID=A0A9P9FGP5_9HYPO|nr:hypothetical protein EDB81DRAFT_925036 [Dactylonectria macrodidyma]
MHQYSSPAEKQIESRTRHSIVADSTEEEPPSIQTRAPDNPTRSEKKRQTDRIAQQKHRRRQREHIAQLEKQLQVIQEGGQSEIAQLVAENTALREEIQQLYGLLDSLQEVTRIGTEIRSQFNESRRKDHQKPPDAEPADVQSYTRPPSLMANDVVMAEPDVEVMGAGDPSELVIPANIIDNLNANLMVGEFLGYGDIPLPDDVVGVQDGERLESSLEPSLTSSSGCSSDNSIWSDGSGGRHVLDHVTSWWLDPHDGTPVSGAERPTAASSYPGPTIYASRNVCAPKWGGLDSLEEDSEYRADDGGFNQERSRQTLNTRLAGLPKVLNPQQSVNGVLAPPFSTHPHSRLPYSITPPPPRDAEMHRILNVTRSYLHEIGPPTFADFLLNNPKNRLSIELKAFTEPMRMMKKPSEFLAAYWILYLFFRWQAGLDEGSYDALPQWLRPTPLQLEIKHHAVLDQVPWPDLRDEVIRLSIADMNKAFEVMKDIGKNLVVDFQASRTLLDTDMGQLQSNILDLTRWKLDNEFFRKHPQWWWLEARQ